MGLLQMIDEAAQWLVVHKRPEKEQRDGYAQTILSDIRGRSISLNDSQKAEAAYLADTFTNYRRRLFGRLPVHGSLYLIANCDHKMLLLKIIWQNFR